MGAEMPRGEAISDISHSELEPRLVSLRQLSSESSREDLMEYARNLVEKVGALPGKVDILLGTLPIRLRAIEAGRATHEETEQHLERLIAPKQEEKGVPASLRKLQAEGARQKKRDEIATELARRRIEEAA